MDNEKKERMIIRLDPLKMKTFQNLKRKNADLKPVITEGFKGTQTDQDTKKKE